MSQEGRDTSGVRNIAVPNILLYFKETICDRFRWRNPFQILFSVKHHVFLLTRTPPMTAFETFKQLFSKLLETVGSARIL